MFWYDTTHQHHQEIKNSNAQLTKTCLCVCFERLLYILFFSVLLEKSYQNKIFLQSYLLWWDFFHVSQCNNQTSQKRLCSFVWGGLKKCPGFSFFFFVKVAQVSWASLNFWHASLMRQPVIGWCSSKNVNRICLWDEINA